jgi:hypothetical protein
MRWTCRCGQEILGQKAEHCTGCHETFTGTRSGDMHRIGPHDGERRCLSPTEMEAKGMIRDKRGYWRENSKPMPRWYDKGPAGSNDVGASGDQQVVEEPTPHPEGPEAQKRGDA